MGILLVDPTSLGINPLCMMSHHSKKDFQNYCTFWMIVLKFHQSQHTLIITVNVCYHLHIMIYKSKSKSLSASMISLPPILKWPTHCFCISIFGTNVLVHIMHLQILNENGVTTTNHNTAFLYNCLYNLTTVRTQSPAPDLHYIAKSQATYHT